MYCFWSADFIINGVLAAGGDTLFDMYSLAVCMWGIAIPLALLGAFVFQKIQVGEESDEVRRNRTHGCRQPAADLQKTSDWLRVYQPV